MTSKTRSPQAVPPTLDQTLQQAIAHHKAGQLPDAERLYRAILQVQPNHPDANHNLGVLAAQVGQHIAGIPYLKSALAINPAQGQYSLSYAEALLATGQAIEALSVMEAAMQRGLDTAAAHALRAKAETATRSEFFLTKSPKAGKAAIKKRTSKKDVRPTSKGAASALSLSQTEVNQLVALFKAGRHAELENRTRLLLERYPNSGFVWKVLGVSLGMQGKDALPALRQASKLLPDDAEAHNNLGNAMQYLGQLDNAIASFRRALEIEPDYAEAHYNLGNALKDLGQFDGAAASYRRALEIRSDYAEAHNNMGNALRDLGQLNEAVASCRRALEIIPDCAEAHNNLGNTLQDLGQFDDAIDSYRQALAITPNYAEAHNNLGNALKSLGQLDEASTSYRRALKIKPDYADAHRNLSVMKRYKPDDPQFAQMLALIASPTLSDQDKIQIGFALGKAYEDIGDADTSFRYLQEGNRLRKKQLGYDIDADKRLFAFIKSTFAVACLPVLEHAQSPAQLTQRPVFIVGMPRSGTTLVEQILASHSQVYGAGELDVLARIADCALRDIKQNHSGQLTVATLGSVRADYLAGLDTLDTRAPCVTDKMPLNFRWTGFILTAIPEARVVHVQRDPIATCWSIFKHYFSQKGNGYAYDLADLAEFYKLYVDLMAFWRQRFPGQIYDLNYETLTENQERETQALLKHCDLTWEDRCLEFHKTKRAVKTASSTQVREEMYRGSSEAWRKYKAHIQPMIAALKG
ncbi:MAG: tetratricopeptide repeat protein [Sulfuritalea sp.]|nr:tetratricopeptide repeat protein [Sulfuritalea sp.]